MMIVDGKAVGQGYQRIKINGIWSNAHTEWVMIVSLRVVGDRNPKYTPFAIVLLSIAIMIAGIATRDSASALWTNERMNGTISETPTIADNPSTPASPRCC